MSAIKFDSLFKWLLKNLKILLRFVVMRSVVLLFLLIAGAYADTRFVEEVRKLAATGLPYVYGSDDLAKGGLDCSGFVRRAAWNAWGVTLPDEAGLQLEYARKYGRVWDKNTHDWSRKVPQPGDLVFWSGTRPCLRPSPVTHVMVYLGDGEIAGSQSGGHRLITDGTGIGIYPFRMRPPEGDPFIKDDDCYRHSMILYAYARLYPAALPIHQKAKTGNE